MKFNRIKSDLKRNYDSYLMLIPFMTLFVIFTVIPVIMAFPMAFTDFDGTRIPDFTGMENFRVLFLSDKIFVKSIGNTLIMSVFTGFISYIISFLLAWLINEMKPSLRTFFTFIFYIPSSAQLYSVWKIIFSGDTYGYLNSFLIEFGIISSPVQWLTDSRYSMWTVIIIQMWTGLGTGFLAINSGIKSIDRTLYEAGAVEGISNRWQELFYITIPSMKPYLLFAGIMQIISAFTADSVIRSLAGFPSTDYSVHTIMTHAYDYAWVRFEMGYASAICTILFIFMYLAEKIVSKIFSDEN